MVKSLSPGPVYKASMPHCFGGSFSHPHPCPLLAQKELSEDTHLSHHPPISYVLKAGWTTHDPCPSPTSILNNRKVPGRDRGVLRNNLGDKATIIIVIVC